MSEAPKSLITDSKSAALDPTSPAVPAVQSHSEAEAGAEHSQASDALKSTETKPVDAANTSTTDAGADTAVTDAAGPTDTAVSSSNVQDANGEQTGDSKPVDAPVTDGTAAVEAKIIEEGYLEHRGPFPKSLFKGKQGLFWFSDKPTAHEGLAQFLKSGKPDTHHLAAWASHTGKGLLFYGDSKERVSGIFNLSDATEPKPDGMTKFILNKHTLKAPSTAERDNWVATLKLKIAEAKEVAKTVLESGEYKDALSKFSSQGSTHVAAAVGGAAAAVTGAATAGTAAVAHAVKPQEVAEGEDSKATGAEAVNNSTTTETVTSPQAEDTATDARHGNKKDDKEHRSSSRKRTSFFGGLMPKKESHRDFVQQTESAVPESAEEDKAVETVPTSPDAKPTMETGATDENTIAHSATTPVEPKTEEVKTERELPQRPVPVSKRSSVFGSFFKKKHSEPPKHDEVNETAAVSEPHNALVKDSTTVPTESAPEIPPVQTVSTPLATDVNDAADAASAAVVTEPATSPATADVKKDMKTDKRKSSLPFTFGKKLSDGQGSPLFSMLRPKNKKMDKHEDSVVGDGAHQEAKATDEANVTSTSPTVPADTGVADASMVEHEVGKSQPHNAEVEPVDAKPKSPTAASNTGVTKADTNAEDESETKPVPSSSVVPPA